jgi:hypothetical protein
MKKMIMLLGMVFTLSTMYAFTGEDAVNKNVLTSFNSDYASATDAVWTVGSNYYKVAFTWKQQKLFAYYDVKGGFIAVARYISPLQLPLALQNSLKKNYQDYWISDLFEKADKEEGTGYYITLENADSKIVMASTTGGDWETFRKTKKS